MIPSTNDKTTDEPTLSVPEQVFLRFFHDLKAAGLAPAVVDRLKIAIDKQDYSEKTLRSALFADNELI